ncbi:aldose 1-epimerase [Nitratireductor sp. B36]|uniref:aldose 1-epimerase n=1 Tax=Nitratireductor sp. B36 TaxID=2762059 RepID=UPI001E2E68A5|nr:aldose 1-epimerase [Nitratireductor sp. B36]MCC5777506.1 aldose 1-epimerase [Nitratireductor sp. B36]
MPDHMILLESTDLRVRVSPRFGVVVDGYHRNGRPFMRPFAGDNDAFGPTDTACFPMVPFSNRVGGNTFDYEGRTYTFEPNDTPPFYIHGEGWKSDWTVVERTDGSVTLEMEHEGNTRSPYTYRAEQRFMLDQNCLTITIEVENRGGDAMPFGLGLHPYFPRTSGMTLEAPAQSWWTEDEYHVPDRNEPLPETVDFSKPRLLPDHGLNHCFEGWNCRARFVWPELGLGASIDTDPVFSRYMLFSPPPDFEFVCFEPMSHTANGFHHAGFGGLRRLSPGEMMGGSMRLTVDEIP